MTTETKLTETQKTDRTVETLGWGSLIVAGISAAAGDMELATVFAAASVGITMFASNGKKKAAEAAEAARVAALTPEQKQAETSATLRKEERNVIVTEGVIGGVIVGVITGGLLKEYGIAANGAEVLAGAGAAVTTTVAYAGTLLRLAK